MLPTYDFNILSTLHKFWFPFIKARFVVDKSTLQQTMAYKDDLGLSQETEDRSPGIHKRHRSIREILPETSLFISSSNINTGFFLMFAPSKVLEFSNDSPVYAAPGS